MNRTVRMAARHSWLEAGDSAGPDSTRALREARERHVRRQRADVFTGPGGDGFEMRVLNVRRRQTEHSSGPLGIGTATALSSVTSNSVAWLPAVSLRVFAFGVRLRAAPFF